MSQYFFNRLSQGYAGEKQSVSAKCKLPWCNSHASKYKGAGSSLCEEHQLLLREYGGPARIDRPWTFNKRKSCDFCGYNPWQHSKVKQIDNELIKDRVAYGMLIVDHIKPQKYKGGDHPENCQTLCLDCNQIKTTLAGDSMPKDLYKDAEVYENIKTQLKPWLDKLFN